MSFPSLYFLLNDLKQAQAERNPLTAMAKIVQTLRNNLDDACMEFENLDDMMYHLNKENEDLIKKLTAGGMTYE